MIPYLVTSDARHFSLSTLAASKSQVIMSNLGNYICCYTIPLSQKTLDCDATLWLDEGLEGFQWAGYYAKEASPHTTSRFENKIWLCVG